MLHQPLAKTCTRCSPAPGQPKFTRVRNNLPSSKERLIDVISPTMSVSDDLYMQAKTASPGMTEKAHQLTGISSVSPVVTATRLPPASWSCVVSSLTAWSLPSSPATIAEGLRKNLIRNTFAPGLRTPYAFASLSLPVVGLKSNDSCQTHGELLYYNLFIYLCTRRSCIADVKRE